MSTKTKEKENPKAVLNSRIIENLKRLDAHSDLNLQTFKSLPYNKLDSQLLQIHYQWIFINKLKWRGSSFPTEAYVFYRKNDNAGVLTNKCAFFSKLETVFSCTTHYVIAIPSHELTDPSVIALYNPDHSVAATLSVADEVVNSCILRTKWDETLGEYPFRFVPLALSTDGLGTIRPMHYRNMLVKMLLHCATHYKTELLYETVFVENGSTKAMETKFRHFDSKRLADSFETALQLTKERIKHFAFIKHDPDRLIGLVSSLDRILYHKTTSELTATPDYSLLDDVREKAEEFVILNSKQLPGQFKETHHRFLFQTARTLDNNFTVFKNVTRSVSELEKSSGKGWLTFYGGVKFHLNDWKPFPLTPNSEASIRYFRNVTKNVHRG